VMLCAIVTFSRTMVSYGHLLSKASLQLITRHVSRTVLGARSVIITCYVIVRVASYAIREAAWPSPVTSSDRRNDIYSWRRHSPLSFSETGRKHLERKYRISPSITETSSPPPHFSNKQIRFFFDKIEYFI
jgi:hypothetical protein